jgi:hypothetical protein
MNNFPHGIKIKRLDSKDPEKKKQFDEVIRKYDEWKEKSMRLPNEKVVEKYELYNDYYNFIYKSCKELGFSNESKQLPSIIEEFLYYLFKDVEYIKNYSLTIGQQTTITDVILVPDKEGKSAVKLLVNNKDQDFAISKTLNITLSDIGGNTIFNGTINVPIVCIESKSFLDKTMLEGVAHTAERIKKVNPYCLVLLITLNFGIGANVDPIDTMIDQIYVLNKSSVEELFSSVNNYLKSLWNDKGNSLGKINRFRG